MRDLLDMDICSYKDTDDCMCLENMPLAYSYVPYQKYEEPYDKEKAHRYGTVFPSLNLPYGVYGNEFITRGVRKI